MRTFEGFVARRYLHARKKGAFVRIMVRFAQVGTALGVFAMLVCTALMNGYSVEIQTNLFRATSHFAVSRLDGPVLDTPAIVAKIRATPGVQGASPIRQETALVRSMLRDAPPGQLQIFGVDPASIRSTTTLFDVLKPIRIEDLREGELVLGEEAARRTGVRVGDDVVVMFARMEPGLSGFAPRTKAMKVAGTFRSGISEYDQNWAYMHLEDTLALAESRDADYIVVRTKSLEAIDQVKPLLRRALSPEHTVLDLRENGHNKQLFGALKVQKWIFTAILSLLVLLAAFNIVASLVMLVTEKRRDLGVLLAMGATPKQIQRTFELQGLRIGITGTLWGLGLGIPFCLIADHFRLIKLPQSVFDFITYLPFRIHLGDLLLVAAFPLVVSWWAARHPARRAASVDPVDAIRAD